MVEEPGVAGCVRRPIELRGYGTGPSRARTGALEPRRASRRPDRIDRLGSPNGARRAVAGGVQRLIALFEDDRRVRARVDEHEARIAALEAKVAG